MAGYIPRPRIRILLVSGLVIGIGYGYNYHSSPKPKKNSLAPFGSPSTSEANMDMMHPHPLPQPMATYVSRPQIERQLHDSLRLRNSNVIESDECKSRTVVVSGPSGVGKSQLVLNYVQTHEHYYQAIFWIEARREETIIRDYTQIYRTRLNPTPNGHVYKIGIHDAINTAKFWLGKQEKRCLWVMDNLNDIGCDGGIHDINLRFYLPASPRVDCIVTTRNANGVEDIDAEISVGVMSEDEAMQLFKKQARLQSTNPEDENEMRAIVEELEYLPLAVTLAGSCVAEDSRMAGDLHQYLRHYQAQRSRQPDHDGIQRFAQYRESTLCALQVSLAAIAQQSPVTSRILELLAFLDFDDIVPDLFNSKAALEFSLEPEEAGENALWRESLSLPESIIDGQTVRSAFYLLQSYSLAMQLSDRTTYTMNEMAYTWITEKLDALQKQKWTPVALELLKQVSKVGQYNMDLAVRAIPHILVAFRTYYDTLGGKRPVTESEQASLVISRSLLSLSGRPKSEQLDHFIYNLTKGSFGLEHPFTLETMFMLAVAKSNHNDYDQAEDLYRETLEIRKRVLGPNHEDTIRTMVSLATTLTYQHRHEDAERLHKEALVLMKEQGIPSKWVLFDCMKYLCFALCDGKKYEEANEMIYTVLELKMEFLGQGHPELLGSMRDIAVIANSQGQHVQAELKVRELLDLQRNMYGLHHPETLLSLKLLGRALADQSVHARNEENYSDLYSQGLCIFGPEHSEMIRSTTYEFSGLKWKKDYEYAEIVGRALLGELEELIRPVDQLTLLVKAYLADVLRHQGKYPAAEKMIREAFNTSRSRFGLEDTITLESLHRLGSILYQQGKYKEGEEVSRLDYQLMERVTGPQSSATLLSMGCLAETLEAGGQYEEALRLFCRMQEPLVEQKGLHHPFTVQAYDAESRIRKRMAQAKRGDKRANPETEADLEVVKVKGPKKVEKA